MKILTISLNCLNRFTGDIMKKICPTCNTKNDSNEEYCLTCSQKLTDDDNKDEIATDKLKIPKDKIILLDLNYTLISNSWKIRYEKLPGKITKSEYEHELVDLIRDNYVILTLFCKNFPASLSRRRIAL